ncbi:MAG: SMC family ATPase, partial [Scytonema sp. PMC 1069.18]|nr:SMC family ATPase [Scytonema sp. PMC 1069.18]
HNAKKDDIKNLTLRLQQAREADQIKDRYALVKTARETYKKVKATAITIQQRLSQAKKQLEQQKAHLEEVTVQSNQMEPHLKAREEALNSAKKYEEQRQQYQIELTRVNNNWKQRQANLEIAKQELKNVENQLQNAETEVVEAEKALLQYSPGGTRLEQLREVSSQLGYYQSLQEQTLKSRQKLEKTLLDKQKAEKKYQEAADKFKQTQQVLQEKQRLLQEAEEANRLALQSNHAAALRQTLHDGDTCPVCNGTYRETELLPLPEVEQVETAELNSQQETAEKEYKAADKAVTKAEATVENYKQKELESQQELAEHEVKLNNLKQEISVVLQTKSWEVDVLRQELEELQQSDRQYHEALAQQKEAAAQVRETQQALEAANKAHTTALVEHDTSQEEVKRWEQQLQQVESQIREITEGRSCAELQAELEEERQKLEKKLQQATKSHQAADRSCVECDTEDKKASDDVDAAYSHREQLQTEWEVALVSAGFTEETFLSAQADSPQQVRWQKEITDYDSTKVRLETQIEEVKSLVGDRTTNESTLNSLRDEKTTAEAQLNQAQNQRANLMAWLQDAQSKQKQVEKQQAELAVVKTQAETYTTLANNLKNNEFQAFILEHLETELVTRATNVLQELTDSRYTLKIQDGDYRVEDNWNGGESRRVQTLSGGETFAASLSMALALSERLSMGAELGSLFLDEGFGTLDTETLETVHQILESLRQQDRLIGIITHVKALGERLPQVKVYKSPEGSRIEVEAF